MSLKLAAACLLASVSVAAMAENSKPTWVPPVDTIPAPRDVPYPGTIKLDIDATDTTRGIFSTKETIPVDRAGPMVLLFPKWLPGNHSPTGQIDKIVDFHIRAGGKEVAWTRDPVEVYAFHIDVPAGVKQIDVSLKFASATDANQGSIVMSPAILRLQWNSMSLYPAGYYTRQIPVAATVRYPDGWTAFSGLPSRRSGANYSYETTNYQVLVDSPTLAGKYAKSWPLTPRVFLDTVADSPAELAATPEQIDAHKRLAEQAIRNFGSQHYDNYHFLFSISDQVGGIGLEHHRSSEDGTKTGYFTKWAEMAPARNLLPHEYTHSWDGKFRRGQDLWTPNFNVPMRNSLLWVYEGQTQFWGYVLQARSGLVSKQETLDAYASIMASLDNRPARDWRDLVDTTNDPILSQRRPKGWVSNQRSEDYYNEGLLVWMEVDSILRRQSGGTKSIDDFAKAFFGVRDGDWGELTYTLQDVVNTLNAVQPYDWNGFLTKRLTETDAPAPLQGFVNNGYRLIYTDTPTDYFKQAEKAREQTDLFYSIGLTMGKEGAVAQVLWDSPAYKQGLTVGDTILGVNGQVYSAEMLKQAITVARTDKKPIALTVKAGKAIRSVEVDYHGGLRYPRLEKVGAGDSGLDRLLAAK